ncbi:MAG: hypothetical protein U9Q20_01895 [Campylobacterota bacterium]|nr:hypothetical protein [Campylobacterota bacterium]
MNIKQYQQQLIDLINDLKKFDANKADKDYIELKKLFDVVCESGVLDITHLEKSIQDKLKLELFTYLSSVSGALSFLTIQILAAYNIMKKNNYSKKEYYLKKKCGISINHLRAPVTVVSAKKVDGGYELNGTLTWASGYKIFDTLLIGFHCDDLEYEVIAKFESQDGFSIDEPSEVFVAHSLNTVNIELKDFFVKDEDIVSSNQIGSYTKAKSASKTVHFCLYGLAVYAILESKNKQFKSKATYDLETIKNKITHSTDIYELDTLRVELFSLVQDIVTTSMILIGGKSVLANQNLQRVYRELIMFNSNGLNDTLKDIFKTKFINR